MVLVTAVGVMAVDLVTDNNRGATGGIQAGDSRDRGSWQWLVMVGLVTVGLVTVGVMAVGLTSVGVVTVGFVTVL